MTEEKMLQEELTALQTEVQKAIENHEFKAFYQPKYDALTSKLTGAEALVRWIMPNETAIMPGRVIL